MNKKNNFKSCKQKTLMLSFILTVILVLSFSSNAFAATVLDEMDKVSDWHGPTWGAANCTPVQDTTIKKSGTGSIKMTTITPGQDMTIETTPVTPRNLSSAKNIELNIYVSNLSTLNTVSLALISDKAGDFNLHEYCNYIGAWELMKGWNTIRRPITDFVPVNSPDWKNINRIQLKVESVLGSTTPTSVNIDKISVNVSGSTEILFSFDDSWRGVYNKAFPYMTLKGMKGTAWVNKGFVDAKDPLTMTIPQLNTIYLSGWDIGNHTVNHPDPIIQTQAEMAAEYKVNRDWIAKADLLKGKLAWTRAADHVCYPMGSYNDALISYLKTIGAKTARTTLHGIQASPVENLYRLKCVAVGRDTDLKFINKTIDDAVATGSDIFFMFHNVADAPVASDPEQNIYVSTANFKKIVDYVAQKRLNKSLTVETISSWYTKYKAANP